MTSCHFQQLFLFYCMLGGIFCVVPLSGGMYGQKLFKELMQDLIWFLVPEQVKKKKKFTEQ